MTAAEGSCGALTTGSALDGSELCPSLAPGSGSDGLDTLSIGGGIFGSGGGRRLQVSMPTVDSIALGCTGAGGSRVPYCSEDLRVPERSEDLRVSGCSGEESEDGLSRLPQLTLGADPVRDVPLLVFEVGAIPWRKCPSWSIRAKVCATENVRAACSIHVLHVPPKDGCIHCDSNIHNSASRLVCVLYHTGHTVSLASWDPNREQKETSLQPLCSLPHAWKRSACRRAIIEALEAVIALRTLCSGHGLEVWF